MTAYEDFATEKVRAGASITGLYPATNPANLTAIRRLAAAKRTLRGANLARSARSAGSAAAGARRGGIKIL